MTLPDISSSDFILGLLACLVAMLLGMGMAKRQARAFSGQPTTGVLPEVTFIDYGDMRFLHLGTPWVQGSMKISKPYEIHLEYQQRMMAWLLFTDLADVHQLHAMQLGLGAASLTKFCHTQLGMPTTAIELNPHVIATCRRWFNLSEDTDKLQVIEGDASDIVQQSAWHERIDVLQVDLYDQEAASPVLDSAAFYANCRNLLTPKGCMVVNVYGRQANFENSVQKIASAFGTEALWAFQPTHAGNTIALAFRTPRLHDKQALSSQAQAVEQRWPLPATKWLKALAPIQRQNLN